VHEVAGRDGYYIGKEIAELRVPAKHQRNQRIDSNAESRDEGAAYDEAGELAEQSAAVWVKRGNHWAVSACSVAASR
jgi:hypothetical protein